MKELTTHRVNSQLNFEECLKHRDATNLGVPQSLAQRCECCQRPYNKQKIGFCFSESQIVHLGRGTPLIFRFSLFVCIFMAAIGLPYSVYLMIQNLNGNFCTDTQKCTTFGLVKLSWGNSSQSARSLQVIAYLSAAFFIIFTIVGFISTKFLLKFSQPIKDYYPNQYSILLRFKHTKNYTEQTIISALKQWWQVQMRIKMDEQKMPGTGNLLNSTYSNAYSLTSCPNIDFIEKVYFYFDYQLFLEVQAELKELQEHKKIHHNEQSVSQFNISKGSAKSQNSYKDIMHQIGRIEQLKKMLHNKELDKTNKCIVTFADKKFAEFFKNRTKKRCGQKQINKILLPGNNYVEILDAPFPSDTFYQTQHIPYEEKWKKRFCANLSIIFAVFIFSGLIIFIIKVSISQKIDNSSYFSPIIALIIMLAGSFICFISRSIVKMEKQPHSIDANLSAIRKMVICSTFIQTIPVVLVFFLYNGGDRLWATGNLIQTVTYLFIFNLIFPHIQKFINFHVISQWSSFRQVKKMSQNSDKICEHSQKQVNKMCEKPLQRIDQEYSWILIQINISLFYAPFIPYSLIITPFSLLINYLTFRLSFVKIYRQPDPSDQTTFKNIYKLFMTSCMWLGTGCASLLFYQIYYEHQKLIPSIVISGAIVLLSLLKLLFNLNFYVPKHDPHKQQLYVDAKRHFIHTYSDFNPIYEFKSHHIPMKDFKGTARSAVLIEELNTMSKSLQGTLKDKLFKETPAVCLQNLGEKLNQSSDMYFQYEIKVTMPEKKKDPTLGSKIPPIFSLPQEEKKLMQNMKKKGQKEQGLIKLNRLFYNEEQEEERAKKKIKEAIKGEIKMNKLRKQLNK